MKWSWKLGKLAGIDVYMHATFLLLIAWIILASITRGADIAGTLLAVAFILVLFGCVVLHELGHALTARRFGIPTRDITLLPIGGVARLERMPEEPKQELLVAIAGPLVNVAIALVLFAGLVFTGRTEPINSLILIEGNFAQRVLIANIWLVIFNLIPAFPMDGGRVLRAALAMKMPYLRATQGAAYLGKAFALVFAAIGFFWNPFLILVALFVYMGASEEATATRVRVAFAGTTAGAAMMTEFRTLSSDNTLEDAIEAILRGSQQDFPVLNHQAQMAGMLTRGDLVAALAQQPPNHPVAAVMRRDFQSAQYSEMLDALLRRVDHTRHGTIPVLDGDALVGLLTTENVSEFFMIQNAINKRRATAEHAEPRPLLRLR